MKIPEPSIRRPLKMELPIRLYCVKPYPFVLREEDIAYRFAGWETLC